VLNFLELVRTSRSHNKLAIGDFLFAEYTCSVPAKKIGNWTETDYLIHVVRGTKTWHTPDGLWKANPGETLFFRKGATILEQHFEKEVCLLMFFLPDGLVRNTVRELAGSLPVDDASAAPVLSAARVENDTALFAFFQSMRTYVAGKEMPSEALLRLKLKELIVSVLTSGRNAGLAAYFRKIGQSDAPSVSEIMESNYRFNLSLEEYARLCHRSLSSFKREFEVQFKQPPGKWLLRKRLAYASALLRGSKMNVTEVVFESGFENVSHFSRVFKKEFGTSPLAFRKIA
jgi:AraC-like DNA-binding protein